MGLKEQIQKAKTYEEAKVLFHSVLLADYPEKYEERCERVLNQRKDKPK